MDKNKSTLCEFQMVHSEIEIFMKEKKINPKITNLRLGWL